MSEKKTVFLVDDEAELRKALNRLLTAEGFVVVEFGSAESFLAESDQLGPGCVLLDIAMPGMDGLEAHRQMVERGSTLPVIFLTAQGGIPESVRAMKAGAVDFLAKPVKRQDLLRAVDEAFEQARLRAQHDEQRQQILDRLARLTPRERQVFEHVISGRLNKVIADRLGTSEQTIKVHRMRVMEKLEADTLVHLVRLAQLAGIPPAP